VLSRFLEHRIIFRKSQDDTAEVEVTWRIDNIKRIDLGIDILVMRRKNSPTSIT